VAVEALRCAWCNRQQKAMHGGRYWACFQCLLHCTNGIVMNLVEPSVHKAFPFSGHDSAGVDVYAPFSNRFAYLQGRLRLVDVVAL
jgi:hypothetical protein